ncbi:MAG: NAD-dependent dehydratase [Robiginitomaculum sp.]|nr:MAG: NAD-dependent dehydratase [Robiginitomaculum sp.]
MKVLVTGGYGFIGASVCARLLEAGHDVVGAGRQLSWAKRRFAAWDWVHCDFNTDQDPEDWKSRLVGIDAVVNCVGVLQDGGADSTEKAHVSGLQSLITACERAGIKRFVHISAIGADPAAGTAYARTKARGAASLKQSNLDWVILEPSLVLGRKVYGGSALIRTLAAMPGFVPMVYGDTKFQPVMMDDLTHIIVLFLRDAVPTKIQVEIAGPDQLSLREILAQTRIWLGFGPARFVEFPPWMAAPLFVLGDFLGKLGIRDALRSTAKAQMQFDVGGDPNQIKQQLDYTTGSMADWFAAHPANAADRLQARLGWAKPASRVILALYWMLSGLIPLLFSQQWSFEIMTKAGLPEMTHWPVWFLGAIADLMLGALLLFGISVRKVCLAMVLLTIGYVSVISMVLPELWFDPLASVLKVFPMIALAGLVAAMEGDR